MNFGQATDQSGKQVKHLNEVWLRYSYSADECWSKVSSERKEKMLPSTSVSLPIKYPHGCSIKKNKVQDLKKVVPFLPEEYKLFYIDLSEPSDSEDSEDSDY